MGLLHSARQEKAYVMGILGLGEFKVWDVVEKVGGAGAHSKIYTKTERGLWKERDPTSSLTKSINPFILLVENKVRLAV